MLSPGDKWKQIPKAVYGPQANLAFRKWLIGRASANRRVRQDLKEYCKHDLLFFVNAFAWTYQPKRAGLKVVPFVSYPCQDRAFRVLVDHIERQRDLVCEKSRDMGMSWICVQTLDWLWRFHEMTQSVLVSRESELVDGKTPDALFWKLDFLDKFLPDWLRPRTDRTKRYRENLDNGSVNIGYATTEKTGVGGRATVMLFDEFSRVDRDIEVRDGTADTSDCRIFNSTHTGPGTAFHGLCTNGVTDKLQLHWTEHPEKAKGAYRYDPRTNRIESLDESYRPLPDAEWVYSAAPAGGPHPGIRSPWYDFECKRRGSQRAIAMDLDIDVSGSMSQFFDPLLIGRLIAQYARDPWWQGDVTFDRDTGKPIGLCPSSSGPLKLWCRLFDGKPKPGVYVFGGDISAGTGATPTCFSGIHAPTGEKVVEYANPHIDPKQAGYVAAALGWLFCNEHMDAARWIWEQQGPGLLFGGKLYELGYTNIYYRSAEMPHTREVKVSERPGWVPMPDNTLILLEDYRSALALGQFLNHSREALSECLQFRYLPNGTVEHAAIDSRNDPTGARANHGDRTVADALGWKLAKDIERAVTKKKASEVAWNSLQWRKNLHADREREEMMAE